MKKVVEYVGQIAEGSGATFLSRVLGWDAAAIEQADISSIAYKVTPKSGTTTASGSVTVATSVYDTLQTDSRWTKDATGYNFAHTVPAAAFSALGRHWVEYTFTPASGEVFKVVFEVEVVDTAN